MKEKPTPRNIQILAAYVAGEKTRLIGQQFGITKQRAIQIAIGLGAKHRVYEPSPGEKGWMMCKVDGCTKTVRSHWGTLCNTHYFRGRRTGSTEDRQRRPPSLTSHGYLARSWKAHPASSKSGILYEHRRVFFDTFGPENHLCHWCHDPLIWGGGGAGKIQVDHLNGDKTDNAPTNLVPSCSRCNTSRGLFMSWLARHSDDPVIRALFEKSGEPHYPFPS